MLMIMLQHLNMASCYNYASPCGLERWQRRYGSLGLISWDGPRGSQWWGRDFWRGFRTQMDVYNSRQRWPLLNAQPCYLELPERFEKRAVQMPKSDTNRGSGKMYPCFVERPAKRQRLAPHPSGGSGSGGGGAPLPPLRPGGAGGEGGGVPPPPPPPPSRGSCINLIEYGSRPWTIDHSWITPAADADDGLMEDDETATGPTGSIADDWSVEEF